MCLSFLFASRRLARRRRLRLASRWHLSAAGEGVFTVGARWPQELFFRKMTFFAKSLKSHFISVGYTCVFYDEGVWWGAVPAGLGRLSGGRFRLSCGYAQSYPQILGQITRVSPVARRLAPSV